MPPDVIPGIDLDVILSMLFLVTVVGNDLSNFKVENNNYDWFHALRFDWPAADLFKKSNIVMTGSYFFSQ